VLVQHEAMSWLGQSWWIGECAKNRTGFSGDGETRR
jgi:hypothetical protein